MNHNISKTLQLACSNSDLDDSVRPRIELSTPPITEIATSSSAAPGSIEEQANSELSEGFQQSPIPGLSHSDRLHFSCFREAEDRLGGAKWTPPAGDVPNTEEENQRCIRQLVSAFKNTSNALDSPRSIYRVRFNSGYYDSQAIEFCAWNILELIKELHTNGFRPYIFDKETIQSMSATQDFTFRRRLDDICQVLEVSKYAAVQVLKGEKTLALVYNPDKLFNSVLSNSKSNAKRSNWIINGRNADETHNPKPKRRKVTHDFAWIASSAPTPTSETPSEANAPSKFTPINSAAHSITRPLTKKRVKRNYKDDIAFMPVFKAPVNKSDSPSKASTADSSSNVTSPIGVAALGDDTLSGTADRTAVNDLTKTIRADNVSPGIAQPEDVNASSVSVINITTAAAIEALSLMRNGNFVNDLNRAYQR